EPAKPATTQRTAAAALPFKLRRRRGDGLVALEEVEGVPVRVLAAREPADAENRLLVVRLAAELPHLRELRVDVVGLEVDDRALARVLAGVDRASRLALEDPIVDPGHPGIGELPAEELAVEALR